MTAPTAPAAPAPNSSRADGRRMQAVIQRRYGDADVLSVGEIDRPAVAPGEVLLQVRAAGLDRGTWHLMTGKPYPLRLAGFGVRAPKNPVPGLDVSGVVIEVGSDVTRFAPGDEVYGIGKGSFAEFAAAREDKLALKPAALTFEQAAALPVSGMTAYAGLADVGKLQPGQRVLVVGASGGVGTYAVQIAKALGAHVTGVASTGKLDLVRSIGADRVIDYTREDFAAGGTPYDLILDVGGNSSLRRLRRALTPRGTLVIAGGENGGRWLGGADRQLRALALSPFVRQRLTTFVSKEHFSGLERMTALVDDGQLVPAIERTLPLSGVAEAMRHLEAGRTRGKLVIVP